MMAMSNNPFLNSQINNVYSSPYIPQPEHEYHPTTLSYTPTKQIKQYWEPENQFNFNNSVNIQMNNPIDNGFQSLPSSTVNNHSFNPNFFYRESNYAPNFAPYYSNEIPTQSNNNNNEYYPTNMNENQLYVQDLYQSKQNNQNIEYSQSAPIQSIKKPDYPFNVSPSSSPYQINKNISPNHSPNHSINNNDINNINHNNNINNINNNNVNNNINNIIPNNNINNNVQSNNVVQSTSSPTKSSSPRSSPFSHFQIKKQTNYFPATPKAVKELSENNNINNENGEIQEISSSVIDTSKLSDKEKMKPNLKKFKFSNKYNYSIISSHENKEQFFDITEYLNLPQSVAAKKLQIPASTLSKRWRESTNNRKWPWRTVKKIDKEIVALLQNVSNKMASEVEANIVVLLKKREEELKTAVIRL